MLFGHLIENYLKKQQYFDVAIEWLCRCFSSLSEVGYYPFLYRMFLHEFAENCRQDSPFSVMQIRKIIKSVAGPGCIIYIIILMIPESSLGKSSYRTCTGFVHNIFDDKSMKRDKELRDMTPGELGRLFPIQISDYDPRWREFFDREKAFLRSHFSKKEVLSVEHIGSTAVPGLKAKPTVDILVQISDNFPPDKLARVLADEGYHSIDMLENPPPHLMFTKGYTKQGYAGQAFHIHVRYKGDWDEIPFRDYLISHPGRAREYEDLKIFMAERYRNDREGYTEAKGDFIEKTVALARKL